MASETRVASETRLLPPWKDATKQSIEYVRHDELVVNNDYDVDDTEDPFEVMANPLPPLPLQNIERYPQENATYFLTKQYVRNDKYKLEKLVNIIKGAQGVSLPSILSAYNKSTESNW